MNEVPLRLLISGSEPSKAYIITVPGSGWVMLKLNGFPYKPPWCEKIGVENRSVRLCELSFAKPGDGW